MDFTQQRLQTGNVDLSNKQFIKQLIHSILLFFLKCLSIIQTLDSAD